MRWPATIKQPPAAKHPEELPPHLLTPHCVDQRVQRRIQCGEAKEDGTIVEDRTLFHRTGSVQQKDGEGGQPTDDEDAQHDCNRLQESVSWRIGGLLVAGTHNKVDANVKDHNGQQDDGKDGDDKQDVVSGVERQESGAIPQVINTVPADNGKTSQKDGHHPACSDQKEHAACFVGAVNFDLGDGDVALYGDGQQAENRGGQCDESSPFSYEPLDRHQMKCPRA